MQSLSRGAEDDPSIPGIFIFVLLVFSIGSRGVDTCQPAYLKLASEQDVLALVDHYIGEANNEPGADKFAREHYPGDYSPYAVAANKEGRTAHTYSKENPEHSDAIFALDIPKAKASTPWSQLEPWAREDLVNEVADRLRKGRYGHDELDDQSGDSHTPSWALVSGIDPLGFSPGKWIGQAEQGGRAGVCRHGNCALAGALLEMGVPAGSIRMVIGAKKDSEGKLSYHIWNEVKINDDEWTEVDATAGSADSSQLRVLGLLGEVFGVEELPKKFSNRKQYPHDQLVIEDFSKPVTLPDRKSLEDYF